MNITYGYDLFACSRMVNFVFTKTFQCHTFKCACMHIYMRECFAWVLYKRYLPFNNSTIYASHNPHCYIKWHIIICYLPLHPRAHTCGRYIYCKWHSRLSTLRDVVDTYVQEHENSWHYGLHHFDQAQTNVWRKASSHFP